MRILFISPYIPSLIRVRPYNLIKYLARRGHRITLLALVPPGEDTGSLDTLRAWCHQVLTVPHPKWRTFWNALQVVPGKTPLQAAYSRSPEMLKLIRHARAREKFDVVHVEHLRGAELSGAMNGTPVVYAYRDSVRVLYEHLLSRAPTGASCLTARFDLARPRHYESHLLEKFDQVLITSPQDKKALAGLLNKKDADNRITVLPNGVDLDYFFPLDAPRDPATLIYTGKMSYHANIAAALDLATQVMPLVWQQHPEAKLVIAGKDPPAQLQELATDPRINLTGFVPDLRPYLAQATLSVLPIRYSVGIQNKVLEAMAMGTPVITTRQTLTALQAEAGQDVVVADTHEAMSQAVIDLLTDADHRRKIGRAGRKYVETHHDWQQIAEKLEVVYRAEISRKG